MAERRRVFKTSRSGSLARVIGELATAVAWCDCLIFLWNFSKTGSFLYHLLRCFNLDGTLIEVSPFAYVIDT